MDQALHQVKQLPAELRIFSKVTMLKAVDATDFKQLPEVLHNYDVYVWIAKPNQQLEELAKENNIAVVNGMPIFMNMNPEKSYKQIIQALKNMQAAGK